MKYTASAHISSEQTKIILMTKQSRYIQSEAIRKLQQLLISTHKI